MKKTTLSIALFALLPIAVQAAETKPVEIVITAKSQQSVEDVAATSHVITTEDIERSQASDVSELLESVSGISISRNGGRGSTSGTFIRGASSSQITVLVDGVRVSSATLGSTEIGHLPVSAIDRIEIVKGPLSGLYGADAIGGVIQIFTKKGANGNNIEIQAGSFGHQKLIAGFSTSNFRASFSREENDGIDATTIKTGGNDDDDGFEETAINLGGFVDINDSTSLSINTLFAKNEIEFDNTFGTDTGFLTENEIFTIATTLDNKINDKTDWSTTVGITNNDSLTDAFFSKFNTDRVSLTSQGQFKLAGNGSAVAGIDYYKEDVDANTSFTETERNNTGLFGQYQNEYGKLGVVANLRVDDNSAYGSNTNGSLALSYALGGSTRLTASYGTSFRAPTFNELYFPGNGNANIQPEESKTVELSLRGGTQGSGTQWRVSAYDTKVDNLISFSGPNFTAINTNEASLQGVEFEIGTYLSNWYFSTSLDLLDATDESTGNQLIRRPETTLKLSANRQFGKFLFDADLLAEKGRFDFGNVELDSFERLDLKGSYKVSEKFTVSAKVANAFDEEYQLASGFNTEGRSLVISGKLNF